jgi:hypothetical protein
MAYLVEFQALGLAVENLLPRSTEDLELLVDSSLVGVGVQEPGLLELEDHDESKEDREGVLAGLLLAVGFPARTIEGHK